MVRIAPDGYDYLVIPFSESGARHENYGTAGVDGYFTDLTGTLSNQMGLYDNAVEIGHHNSNSATRTYTRSILSQDLIVTPSVTLSAWVYLKYYTYSSNIPLFGKQITSNSWSSPFYAIGMRTLASSDDVTGWKVQIASSNTERELSLAATSGFNLAPLRWHHIGATWNGTTLLAYHNGVNVGTLTPSAGAIDYGTLGSRGVWFAGNPPGAAVDLNRAFIIEDMRVANVVRPASYFKEIYYNGAFVNGS